MKFSNIAGRATGVSEANSLHRITLHECRHTYASLLMAAGYTLTAPPNARLVRGGARKPFGSSVTFRR